MVPGLLGLIVISFEIMHAFYGDSVASWAYYTIQSLYQPRPTALFPIPILEPLVSSLVAPLEVRRIHQELVFLGLLVYFTQVILVSIRQYKMTGEIFGEFSFQAFTSGGIQRPERSHSNELGSADLASAEQIAKWTKKRSGQEARDAEPYTTLEVEGLKGSDGVSCKQGKLYIPRGERNRHMLIVAKNGGGKTTRFILPNSL